MSDKPFIVVPSKPNSIRCKLGFHKEDMMVHMAFALGGYDPHNTFGLMWCTRCDRLKLPKRGSRTLIVDIHQVSPEHWTKAMDALMGRE